MAKRLYIHSPSSLKSMELKEHQMEDCLWSVDGWCLVLAWWAADNKSIEDVSRPLRRPPSDLKHTATLSWFRIGI